MGRRRSGGGRISPSARLLAVAAMGVAVVVLAAIALTDAAPYRTRATHHRSRAASNRATSGRSVLRHTGAVPARQLTDARSAARQFMGGYLRVAYGQASPSSIRAVGASLRRRLRQRALDTSAERGRHPRVISLTASGQRPGVVLATAIIDDGGIAAYAVRLVVRETRLGWRVSAVESG